MESPARRFISFSSLALFGLLAIFLVVSTGPATPSSINSNPGEDAFRAPKRNVWAEIPEDEAREVYDFVAKELSHLNLTEPSRPGAGKTNNFIFNVERLRPNKTDALPYFHGDAEEPEKWAKVAVSETMDHAPYMVFYMVGPLPVSESTKILPLNYAFNNGKNYVKNPVHDFFALVDFSQKLAQNMSDITRELLGAQLNIENPEDPDSLLTLPRVTAVDSGGLMLWIQFFRMGLGSNAATLLPQGLYVKVDARSEDFSEWKAGKIYYNGIIYEDGEELRDAIRDPDFIRAPKNLDGPWTDTENFDAHPDGRELPPPISVQPYGRRYKLDRQQKFVSWFGFDFYITTAPTGGVSLYDIRFKGELVIYELGLQEAMAHYAGNDPTQGGLEFMDAFFGMGRQSFELMPGYDCPAYADYLDTSWNQVQEFKRVPNSICIFEYTSDHLLTRHSAQFSVTASRNTYLVVRFVATVGNYDYTFDYTFYMDGSVEVKVRASGFIFSAFRTNNSTKEQNEYGHRIHDALNSAMHDHVINFKADLDVAGTRNDMVSMAMEPLTRSFPWDLPEIKERNTMHLVETPIDEETGLEWTKNSQTFYIVYSSDKKNAWDERKGYRITSGTGMGNTVHLTIENSTVLGDAARWAEKDLWVVRRRDTEPASADPLNWFAPHDPIINFTGIANHESLKHGDDSDYDGDLVVYFNLGAHHVPHSGDIPNTLMHTSGSSVMFVPHNFNDRDPSRETVQGVRLQLKGDISGGFAGSEDEPNADLRNRLGKRTSNKKEHKAKYFGATYDGSVKVPLDALEPNLVDLYESAELGVTDLGLNGTAGGVWFRGG